MNKKDKMMYGGKMKEMGHGGKMDKIDKMEYGGKMDKMEYGGEMPKGSKGIGDSVATYQGNGNYKEGQ